VPGRLVPWTRFFLSNEFSPTSTAAGHTSPSDGPQTEDGCKTCTRERMAEMRNSYEAGEIVDLGKAEHLILGVKYLAPFDFDWLFGMGFISWFFDDIDEGDE
jgi:hypothetical protein